MTREEILQAIEINRQQIYHLKAHIDLVTDSQEEKRLIAELKELQVRQFWFMDQMSWQMD